MGNFPRWQTLPIGADYDITGAEGVVVAAWGPVAGNAYGAEVQIAQLVRCQRRQGCAATSDTAYAKARTL